MNESRGQVTTTAKSIGKEILALFLHVPLAMAAGTFIGLALNVFIGLMLAILGFRTNQLPDLGVLNPLLWSGSLFLGALINRRTHDRSAYWVAGVGCSYLLAVFLSDVSGFAHSEYYWRVSGGHYLRYEYRLLFSPCTGDKCLGQMIVTLPFLNSIAYSVGAWLGLRVAQASEGPSDTHLPPLQ